MVILYPFRTLEFLIVLSYPFLSHPVLYSPILSCFVRNKFV